MKTTPKLNLCRAPLLYKLKCHLGLDWANEPIWFFKGDFDSKIWKIARGIKPILRIFTSCKYYFYCNKKFVFRKFNQGLFLQRSHVKVLKPSKPQTFELNLTIQISIKKLRVENVFFKVKGIKCKKYKRTKL